ncbi:MAG: M23 family metallopeptidase, partial [Actinomycetota bacterium]|nr:M23 family metallopeptidase [Actinomycetota bacterium]
ADAARAAALAAPVPVTGAAPPAGGLPAPPVVAPVGGKVCPVSGTTGFIDSWGFARSGGRTHEGVDIFAAYATPVLAVADGVVDSVYNNSLGGLVINFIDDNGDKYYYAHLSSASASSGQRVTAGTVIGAVGTSGNAAGTPPHLHWQYHPGNGEPINPFPLARALCR